MNKNKKSQYKDDSFFIINIMCTVLPITFSGIIELKHCYKYIHIIIKRDSKLIDNIPTRNDCRGKVMTLQKCPRRISGGL